MFALNIIISSALVIGVVLGSGEVNILSYPPSIELRGHEPVDANIVGNMMAAAVGFTTDHITNFQGMSYNDPWNFANCLVLVNVGGPKKLDSLEGHTFPFADSNTEAIRNSIETRIYEHNPFGQNQTVMEVNLEDGLEYVEMFGGKLPELKEPRVKHLNPDEDEDRAFVKQMALWEGLLEMIKESGPPTNTQPDLFWINVRGLHPIVDMYGDSKAGQEATNMVVSLLQKTKDAFEQKYGKKTMVMSVVSDAVHTRRFRRNAEVTNDRNLAQEYDENYPVIFNIFLWFTIAFVMSLIAISMVTACMDPGRDSIIYRMTSTRMKKDN